MGGGGVTTAAARLGGGRLTNQERFPGDTTLSCSSAG